MRDVACRTNFLPATDSDKVLPSIVVSGLALGATAENIMQERTDVDYSQGWVLDVSSVERQTKVNVEKCGGLGYVDMKIALYGIPESGLLQLWLPVESHVHEKNHAAHNHEHVETASHWFDSLVICEANEKRAANACQLDPDLELTIGGVTVPSSHVQKIKGAGEYLKRPTCVHVPIPESAKITKFQDLVLNAAAKRRLSSGNDDNGNDNDNNRIGLLVHVRVISPSVTRKAGACCLSHVAWELH
jgi:hypothetical protein